MSNAQAHPPSAHPRNWPLFRSLRGLSPAGLGFDLIAGLTLAAIAIPEQMATARLGGFPPGVGLIAFVVAAVGFAVFGANRQLSTGADSTITPIFAGALALLAATGSPNYAELAAALAMLVGVILVLAGLLRLGWIADLLSAPVITGFLAGVSVHILLSQAPTVMGVAGGSGGALSKISALVAQAHAANPTAIAIGLGVFAVIFATEKLNPKIPGALIALVLATLATIAFDLDHHGLPVLGQVSGALPAPQLPHLHPESLRALVGLAGLIALVVMMQTAATSRAYCPEGQDPDINGDYTGVGAAAILAGLFGAFPVNASPPRTAVVSASGGRSQASSLFAGLVVLLLALFGGALLARAPTAALAGVLLFVAQRIFRLDSFRALLGRARIEFALAVGTALLIVLLPIQTGVSLGVFLSLAHGVFAATQTRPIPFERAAGTTVWWPAPPGATAHNATAQNANAQNATAQNATAQDAPGVIVMGFQAPLSFLNAYEFRRGVMRALDSRPPGTRLLVLEASSLVEIDYTASTVLADVITEARKLGVDFAVARLESVRAQEAFDRLGLTAQLGPDHLFHTVAEAVDALAPSRPTLH
jgi:SulP family sulfate permease